MKKLSLESFQKAKTYIYEYGRVIDQRLFDFHFENGSKESVIEVLKTYQNQDSGFGNALEPDLRSPLSSVYTTSQGIFILREVGATSEEAIVKKAIQYLLDNYDEKRSIWQIIPREALDTPHAGHWDEIIEKEFDNFFTNMRAGIVGHLYHYSDLIPEGFAEKIMMEVMETLTETQDEKLSWIFDLWSYLGLMSTNGLSENYKSELFDKLSRVIPQQISKNHKNWTMMSVSPINMAPTPDSPMASFINHDLIQINLDFDIENQLSDGTWPLDWSWEQDNLEAWRIAEKEWKAHLFIGKLKTLKAYGRIK